MANEISEAVLRELYYERNYTFQEIADFLGHHISKIKRYARRYNLKGRNKSEAAKLALQTGRLTVPSRKGVKLSDNIKKKIGVSVSKTLEKMPEDKKRELSEKRKQNWDNMGEEKRHELYSRAGQALKRAAKIGSKLELFLVDGLNKAGYTVEHHAERKIGNDNMHLDLVVRNPRVAIEVDGPRHYDSQLSTTDLSTIQERDHRKNILLINAGYRVLRLQNRIKRNSMVRFNKALQKVIEILKGIENTDPSKPIVEIVE